MVMLYGVSCLVPGISLRFQVAGWTKHVGRNKQLRIFIGTIFLQKKPEVIFILVAGAKFPFHNNPVLHKYLWVNIVNLQA